jgi:ribosomal protein S18 acetylase RimI-like enzyme
MTSVDAPDLPYWRTRAARLLSQPGRIKLVASIEMGDVDVRDAVPSDLPFMQLMLYEAANRPGTEWPSFPETMEEPRIVRFWNGLMTRPGDVGVIAEHRGEAIGAAWVRRMGEGERGPLDDPTVPVLAIGIVSSYRGVGIGGLLMKELLDRVRASGERAIDLTTGSFNEAGVRLYHRHGFVDVSQHDTAIRMRLKFE